MDGHLERGELVTRLGEQREAACALVDAAIGQMPPNQSLIAGISVRTGALMAVARASSKCARARSARSAA
jgi:hypothetical protein